jgi:hypothetical protein
LTKKPKVTHVVESIIISCSEHGVFMIPVAGCSFTGGESECEMCGSHGSVEVSVECPGCLLELKPKQKHRAKVSIELNCW